MLKSLAERHARHALTRTGGYLRFTHTLNPYIGCAFACRFCYVQGLTPHQVRSHDTGEAWGEYVEAKRNLPGLLRREMRRLRERGRPVTIYCSSATDPYQGAEAVYGITRGCLEVLAEEPPDALVIQTRSPLVVRDLDLLARVPNLLVSMTIETDGGEMVRRFMPRAPRPAKRHAAIREVGAAGIRTQVAVSPVLPCEPERFVDWLLQTGAGRYVVDTFTSGDGRYGKRSEAFGVPEMLAAAGRSGWWDDSAGRRILQLLRERVGEGRVLWSREGFNDLGFAADGP